MKAEIISIKSITTEDMGSLAFFEANKDIDFEIKRIYYIFDVKKGIQRGGHAHKSLKQVLFCPYGSIKILLDDGYENNEIILETPTMGIVIQEGIWRDMIWNKDNSVLCVAASEYYDELDYIRDYKEFKQYAKEGYWN